MENIFIYPFICQITVAIATVFVMSKVKNSLLDLWFSIYRPPPPPPPPPPKKIRLNIILYGLIAGSLAFYFNLKGASIDANSNQILYSPLLLPITFAILSNEFMEARMEARKAIEAKEIN